MNPQWAAKLEGVVITNALARVILLTMVVVGLPVAGQEQDPNFDSRVTNPAYPNTHPKVLMDQGHFNPRTPAGQSVQQTFKELLTHDGYEVDSSDGRFG